MKPLGRKHYKGKTGGKHHVRINGKFSAWWLDVCEPNKTADKEYAKKSIQNDIDEYLDGENNESSSKECS